MLIIKVGFFPLVSKICTAPISVVALPQYSSKYCEKKKKKCQNNRKAIFFPTFQQNPNDLPIGRQFTELTTEPML